jgi:CBS domain-containing protein
VADVMDTQPVWVPGDTTVLQAQDEFFLRYRWPWFPVADPISGRFLGLLHQHASTAPCRRAAARARLRRGRRGRRRGLPRPRRHPIEHLLGSEGLRSLGALMVIDSDERLRGVVTLEQVRRRSRRRRRAARRRPRRARIRAAGSRSPRRARGRERLTEGGNVRPPECRRQRLRRRVLPEGRMSTPRRHAARAVVGKARRCCTRAAAARSRARACSSGPPARRE